ncbi:hypothetical protein ACIBHX_16915 [Nonomuraea sp. NPDC050536]
MDSTVDGLTDATGREFGLQRILDSLEVFIASRSRGGRSGR